MICPNCKNNILLENITTCPFCAANLNISDTQNSVLNTNQNSQPIQPVNEPNPKQKKKKGKALKIILILLLVAIISVPSAYLLYVNSLYNEAVTASTVNPVRSYYTFEDIVWYKDSATLLENQKSVLLEQSLECIANHNFDTADKYLGIIHGHPGVDEAYIELNYQKAIDYYNHGKYASAKKIFTTLNGYKDTSKYMDSFVMRLKNNGSYQVETYTGQSYYTFLFHGDTVFIIQYPDSSTFSYILVSTDELHGLWLTGVENNGNIEYFEEDDFFCAFEDPIYDENGEITGFTVFGMKYTFFGI